MGDGLALWWLIRRMSGPAGGLPSTAGWRLGSLGTAADLGRCALGRGCALAFLALAGCASIGPGTVPGDRVGYADALSESWKDQMLLNIVRLRYGDAPTFMDVGSVVSAYTVQGQVTTGLVGNFGLSSTNVSTPGASGNLGAVGAYAERPTISYLPLSGAKFAKSLLEPIPPAAIFSLIAAGYPADFVIPQTVRALNGVYGRTIAAGTRHPEDPEFALLVAAIRRIQLSRLFSMRFETREQERVAFGVFAARRSPQLQQDIDFVKKTLALKPINDEMILAYGALPRHENELAVLSRSMLEILNTIAADIDAPTEDVASGRTYANGESEADASVVDLSRIKIHSGPTPPADAFTAIRYRNVWYWISDRDFNSKRGLTFLLLFFSLAETGAVPTAPVLTIPVQ